MRAKVLGISAVSLFVVSMLCFPVQALQISEVRFSNVANNSFVVTWLTDGDTGGGVNKVDYWPNSAPGTVTTQNQTHGDGYIHVAEITTNVESKTDYTFTVTSEGVTSAEKTLKTPDLGAGGPPPLPFETSYRLMNRARANTTSRNAAIRLLLVGLGFLLVNVWVCFRWSLLLLYRRYNVSPNYFTLNLFCHFVSKRIEELYGTVIGIEIVNY